MHFFSSIILGFYQWGINVYECLPVQYTINISVLALPLWLCFTTTINHSIQLVKCSLPILIFIGVVVFPLSYLSGHKLDAVGLGYSLFHTIITWSIVWVLGILFIFYCLKIFYLTQNDKGCCYG